MIELIIDVTILFEYVFGICEVECMGLYGAIHLHICRSLVI